MNETSSGPLPPEIVGNLRRPGWRWRPYASIGSDS